MVTILKGMNQLNLRLANSTLEVSFILNDFIKFRFKSEARVVLDVVPLIFFMIAYKNSIICLIQRRNVAKKITRFPMSLLKV